MKSDESEQTDFVPLGRYSPREAAKLLERFEHAGIAFRAQPRKPSQSPDPQLPSTSALIQRELVKSLRFIAIFLATACRIISRPSFVTTITSNPIDEPTAPLRNKFSVFATTACRGLSLSRYA
jgi:hypothetical protein